MGLFRPLDEEVKPIHHVVNLNARYQNNNSNDNGAYHKDEAKTSQPKEAIIIPLVQKGK